MDLRAIVKVCIKYEEVFDAYFRADEELTEHWKSKIEKKKFEMFMSKSNLL